MTWVHLDGLKEGYKNMILGMMQQCCYIWNDYKSRMHPKTYKLLWLRYSFGSISCLSNSESN